MMVCSIDNCEMPSKAHGMCSVHYQRHYRQRNRLDALIWKPVRKPFTLDRQLRTTEFVEATSFISAQEYEDALMYQRKRKGDPEAISYFKNGGKRNGHKEEKYL